MFFCSEGRVACPLREGSIGPLKSADVAAMVLNRKKELIVEFYGDGRFAVDDAKFFDAAVAEGSNLLVFLVEQLLGSCGVRKL